MAGSEHLSRRDFVKWTTAAVGAFITAAIGLPALDYLIAPALAGRPIVDYTTMERPAELPAELVFAEGEVVATRKASEAWFAWAMKNSAFFYIGAGDLMKSILTGKAENVYGILSRTNQLGRGIRFGIAEQNMAMMS